MEPSTTKPVLIDARPLQGHSAQRGIGTYVRNLLAALVAAGFGSRLALLLDAGLPIPELPPGEQAVYRIRRRYRGRLAPYEDAALLASELARIRPALYHATTLSLPGRKPVCPLVVTLHDLIPWALGGQHQWGERLRYRIGRSRLKAADRVICPSAATAADAMRLAGVIEDRSRVIPEGVDPGLKRIAGASGKRWGIEKPFLLFVGALDVRKDPAGLLGAWQTARAQGADCQLVLAGAAGSQAPRFLGGARQLGHVPIPELAELLSAAACLVFPSRYEGFGLPVLEAMACGCPVVAYRNSSLAEVAGDAGTLVSDGDAAALGRAAATLVLDPQAAARARNLGMRQAAKFSWKRAAHSTIATYEEVLKGRAR
jgi:glycosyltransferase involved in cell wall biosynthesis